MREKYYLHVVDDETEDKKDQNPGREPEAHSHLLCCHFSKHPLYQGPKIKIKAIKVSG